MRNNNEGSKNNERYKKSLVFEPYDMTKSIYLNDCVIKITRLRIAMT